MVDLPPPSLLANGKRRMLRCGLRMKSLRRHKIVYVERQQRLQKRSGGSECTTILNTATRDAGKKEQGVRADRASTRKGRCKSVPRDLPLLDFELHFNVKHILDLV